LKQQKKMPRPAKENCFVPQIQQSPCGAASLLVCGSCWLEALTESGYLLPGALYPLLCGSVSPHLAAWVLAVGGRRKLVLPAPLPLPRRLGNARDRSDRSLPVSSSTLFIPDSRKGMTLLPGHLQPCTMLQWVRKEWSYLRKYCFTEKTRWREILSVLRWQLELRISDAQRRRAKNGSLSALDRELLQTAYNDSRFLHRFLGRSKETKLEQAAAELLHQAEE